MAPSEKSNLLPTNANGLQSTSVPPSDSTRMVLYSSHFFAQWAERMWEFSISLFLIAIAPQSIFLVSTYGLFQCLMIIMTGSYAGNYIDTTARMRAVRIILLLQNGSVVICSLFCYWLLFAESDGDIDESHSHDLVPPAWAAKVSEGAEEEEPYYSFFSSNQTHSTFLAPSSLDADACRRPQGFFQCNGDCVDSHIWGTRCCVQPSFDCRD